MVDQFETSACRFKYYTVPKAWTTIIEIDSILINQWYISLPHRLAPLRIAATMAAWLPQPVAFDSAHSMSCDGFTPEQCAYYQEHWHNW